MTTYEIFDQDGDSCGVAQPIRFSDGSIGWQLVGKAGQLLGLIDRRGNGGDPTSGGCRDWSLCQETSRHRDAIQKQLDSEFIRIVTR